MYDSTSHGLAKVQLLANMYNTGGLKDMSHLYNAENILRWARRYKLKHYFTGEVEQYEAPIQTNTRRVIQVIVEK